MSLLSADSQSKSKRRNDADASISPAAFLHSLRENGVSLSIEEEATLLDCLDTERQAEVAGRALEGSRSAASLAVAVGYHQFSPAVLISVVLIYNR